MNDTMKLLFSILFIVSLLVANCPVLIAQIPPVIHYQAGLNDDAGTPLTGSHTITFRLYTGETGGTPIWTEIHEVDIDSLGFYDVMLGSITSFESASVDFSIPYWLSLSVDGSTEMDRHQIAASPYAFHAQCADIITGIDNIVNTINDVSPDDEGNMIITGGENITVTGVADSNKIRIDSRDYPHPHRVTLGDDLTDGALFARNTAGQIITRIESTNDSTQGILSSTRVNNRAAIIGQANGSGNSPGVIGLTNSPSTEAAGVKGIALNSAADAISHGVIGETHANGNFASGVMGITDGEGINYGVYGKTGSHAADSSTGVFGEATGTQLNFGVRGVTHSTTSNACGILGEAIAVTDQITYGVRGIAKSTGYGSSGVEGLAQGSGTTYGVSGYTTGFSSSIDPMGAAGVLGSAGVGSKGACGVVGVSVADSITHGVKGLIIDGADSSSGVFGFENFVMGTALAYGVHGRVHSNVDHSCGVLGEAMATTGVVNGVRGVTYSNGGNGVVAEAKISGGAGLLAKAYDDFSSGIVCAGNLTVSCVSGMNLLFWANTIDSTVRVLDGIETVIAFGGRDHLSAIQKVNGTAIPTPGGVNDFSILGESPITVTTNDHGVTIGCPECCTEPCGGGGGGISCACESTLTVGSASRSGVIKVRTASGEVAVTLTAADDYGPKIKSSIPVSSGLLSIGRFEAYEGTPYDDAGFKAALKGYWNSATYPGDGIYGFTNANEHAGVFGKAAPSDESYAYAYGIKGVTDFSGHTSAGVLGIATSTLGSVNGVTGKSHANNGIGVNGEAVSDTGTAYGVRGYSSSTDTTAAGVLGVASTSGGSSAFKGIGSLKMYYLDGYSPKSLFKVLAENSQVNMYENGELITAFGGSTRRVAIQKVNGSATPTIPDNNFTVVGDAPITVTTGDHGVTIGCPDCCTEPCGGGGGGCNCDSIMTIGVYGNPGELHIVNTEGEDALTVTHTTEFPGTCKLKVGGNLKHGKIEVWESTGTFANILLSPLNSYFLCENTSFYDIFAEGDLEVLGNTIIEGDLDVRGVKDFRVPHPELDNMDIRFACTESPEVMIEYCGVLQLESGYGEAKLSHEFQLMSEPGSYRIICTPMGREDPGRISAEVTDAGVVKIYSFDGPETLKVTYNVKATRIGYKNRSVVIPSRAQVNFRK